LNAHQQVGHGIYAIDSVSRRQKENKSMPSRTSLLLAIALIIPLQFAARAQLKEESNMSNQFLPQLDRCMESEAHNQQQGLPYDVPSAD
jgi:hypothetical protein